MQYTLGRLILIKENIIFYTEVIEISFSHYLRTIYECPENKISYLFKKKDKWLKLI